MFESIRNIFKKTKKREMLKPSSKDAAKERLHLVLMQDRANVSADFLDLMRREIIEVIKKYIEIDEEAIDVRLTNETNEDGVQGAPALYANIPIINIKDETRKLSKTNQEIKLYTEPPKNKEIEADKNKAEENNKKDENINSKNEIVEKEENNATQINQKSQERNTKINKNDANKVNRDIQNEKEKTKEEVDKSEKIEEKTKDKNEKTKPNEVKDNKGQVQSESKKSNKDLEKIDIKENTKNKKEEKKNEK